MTRMSQSGFKVEQKATINLNEIGDLGLVVNSEHVFRDHGPVPNGFCELCVDARNLDKDNLSQIMLLLPGNTRIEIHPRASYVFVCPDFDNDLHVELIPQNGEQFQNVVESRNLN